MHGRILWHTKYNQYFRQNVKMMDRAEFIRELVQHIPPKRIQLIRRYALGGPDLFLTRKRQMERDGICGRARSAGLEGSTRSAA